MMICAWPKGCDYTVLSDTRLCYLHAKYRDGLFSTAERRPYAGVPLSDIVSAEQLEIARVMTVLGAKPAHVRMAFSKRFAA